MLSRLHNRIKRLKKLESISHTRCAKIAQKFYKYTKHFKFVPILGLIIMPYLIRPQWCLDKFHRDHPLYDTCGFNKTYALDDPSSYYKSVGYPNSGTPYVDDKICYKILIGIYLVFAYFLLIKVFYKKITKTALIRLFGISSIIIYSIVSYICMIISTTYNGNFLDTITDFLIIVIFVRSLRTYWTRITKVVLGSITTLIILIFYVLFFALLGFIMFPDYDKFDSN